MARLNDQLDSDDEFPDLSSILNVKKEAIVSTLPRVSKLGHGEIWSQKKQLPSLTKSVSLIEGHEIAPKTLTKVSSDKPQSSKQRPLGHLKQAYANSLLLSMSSISNSNSESENHQSLEVVNSVQIGDRLKKLANSTGDYSRLPQKSAGTDEMIHRDDYSSTDLSGFIVPDSASDEEAWASRSPKKKKKEQKSRSPKKIQTTISQERGAQESRQPRQDTGQSSGANDLILLEEKHESKICHESSPSNEPFGSELSGTHLNLDDCLT